MSGSNTCEEYDELAVQFVLAGYQMKLRGADRVEAVCRMVNCGMSCEVMTARLKMSSVHSFSRWASRHGIKLSKRPTAHWTYAWLAEHRGTGTSRRWSNGDFTYDGSKRIFDT